MTSKTTTTALGLVALAAFSTAALANPVDGIYFDGPLCDSHGDQIIYEELGTGAFPSDELISAVFTQTNLTACPATDDPGVTNFLVEITNLSGRVWHDLYYVADPDTSFSNVDGLSISAAAPGALGETVRLDTVGFNRPLVFESMTGDNVFEIGETWAFVLQDWGNAIGLTPDLMGSLDFAGASAADFLSTGSIVAMRPVPTPASLALLSTGAVCLTRRRR